MSRWALLVTAMVTAAVTSGDAGTASGSAWTPRDGVGALVGSAGDRAQRRAVPCGETGNDIVDDVIKGPARDVIDDVTNEAARRAGNDIVDDVIGGAVDNRDVTDDVAQEGGSDVTDDVARGPGSDVIGGVAAKTIDDVTDEETATSRGRYGAAYGVGNGTDYGVGNGTDYGVGNGTGNGTAVGNGGTELSMLHRSLLAVLSALVISALSPLGAAVLLCGRCPALQWALLQLLLAVGAGALSGDAVLHLLPQFLQLHTHGAEEEEEEEEGGHAHEHGSAQPWQLLAVLGALFAFFVLERVLRIARGRSHERGAQCGVGVELRSHSEGNKERSDCGTAGQELPPHSALSDEEMQRNALRALPVLLTLGDAVHNAADGVALGAAFSASWRSGVATAVAVLCHELPHELGDMAALLGAGLSCGRAVLLNVAAAVPALLGVFIGIGVGAALGSEGLRWVCGAAAGIFLYIALCDVVPALSQERSARPWALLGLHCVGLLSGWALLLLIAVLEDTATP